MIDFDPTTIPLGYTYDAAGNVLTRKDINGLHCYAYDEDGRVMKWYSREMDSNSTGDEAPDADLLALRIVLIICLVAAMAHAAHVAFA